MNSSGGASDYIGSGAYCFSNSAAMALAATGVFVDPAYIEVATGSPFGMQWEGDEPAPFVFPDPPGWNPAIGLATFFNDHGFTFDLSHSTEFRQAKTALIRHVEDGFRPILGPVDVGLLPYRPGSGAPTFSDHYVAVVGTTLEGVIVHDPGGYPASPISWTDLEVLWTGETISYAPGPYPQWTVGAGTSAEVLGSSVHRSSVLALVRNRGADGLDSTASVGAIERLARVFREGDVDYLNGHLVWFALPLASRRWSDAATVVGVHDELRRAMSAVSWAFGAMQACAVRRDYAASAGHCDVIGALWQEMAGALRC